MQQITGRFAECFTMMIFIFLIYCLPVFAQDTLIKTTTLSETEKWRADLRFMAEEMTRRHKNLFHTVSREEFAKAVKSLDERLPSLARHQIIVEMAKIVTMIGDGHTNIAPTRDPKIGFRVYPIKLYFFKEDLIIRSAAQDFSEIVGARVVKIGNASTEEAYKAVREIIGRDNEMGVKFFAPHLLVMPEILHALGLIENMENAKFTIETQGKQKVIELKPFGAAEMMPSDKDLSWMAKEGWVDMRSNSHTPLPLWLKDPTNNFWYEYLPDSKTVYVQYNQVGNKENETIVAFTERLFKFVEANPVERLVLDLRINRGGNGELNRPFLLGFIKSSKINQRGKLFTIIGRSTFSAAQFLVDDLEKYTETIFVGDPSSSKGNHFSDSRRITLPNSGITVRVSIYYWQNWHPLDRRIWTAPQIAAELTSEDYRANIDTAMKAILAYQPQKNLTELLSEALSSNNLSEAVKLYREFKNNPVNKYVETETEINQFGYSLISTRKTEQAVEILKLNTESYPQSANAFDSLAEAYLAAGKTEMAIKTYEQALKIDPTLSSAIDALNRLRKKD